MYPELNSETRISRYYLSKDSGYVKLGHLVAQRTGRRFRELSWVYQGLVEHGFPVHKFTTVAKIRVFNHYFVQAESIEDFDQLIQQYPSILRQRSWPGRFKKT